MGGDNGEQQDVSSAAEPATEAPSPATVTPPAQVSPAPASPAPAPPKASVAANLACLAVLPLAVLGGVLAQLGAAHESVRFERLAAGACLFTVLGVGAALFARLAHRRPTEWIALAIASFPWVLWSISGDLVHRHRVAGEASRALTHLGFADKLLAFGNAAASSTGLVLAALALAFALLARAPSDAHRAGLSRTFLVLSIGPGAFLALAISVSAHLSGFALVTIALSATAVVRVARNVELSSQRSLALAWAACLAAGAAVAASTTGAASYGLLHALSRVVRTVEPAKLGRIVHGIGTLELSQLSPLFAVLPCLALLFAIDAQTNGRGWARVPRLALALSTLVALLALWFDGRNALDVRRQIDRFLDASGVTDLVAVAPAIDALPVLSSGTYLEREGFVLVTAHGDVRYRGASVPGGLSGLTELSYGDALPPVMLDAHAPSSTALAIVAQATAAGLREVRFVGRAAGTSGLATIAWGPRFSPPPRYRYDRIVLMLKVSPEGCVLASSAGDYLQLDRCEELDERLDERHRLEPNRRDIVLVPSAELEHSALLHVLDLLETHGYTERYAGSGVRLF